MLKFIRHLDAYIEMILKMPEQTTIFDFDVMSDEDLGAELGARLPLPVPGSARE